MEEILVGTTDHTILVFIPDPASTDGSGITGLAHSAITVSYTRVETDNDVAITDVTSSMSAITNLTDAHVDWGWKEVSATLAPGLYRLDVADALFASGAWYVVLYVMITSGLAAAIPKAFLLKDPIDGFAPDVLLQRIHSYLWSKRSGLDRTYPDTVTFRNFADTANLGTITFDQYGNVTGST